jgi:hypothetical protein
MTFLFKAVLRASAIAERAGKSLFKLFKSGLDPQRFHCVGHSIGSHICGNAGREIIRRSFGRFKFMRISALDPAFRYYYHYPILGSPVTKLDATFVDAIHTDAIVFGSLHEVGHADFYPDSGVRQSACPQIEKNLLGCEFCLTFN